jgi:hypothetical protein
MAATSTKRDGHNPAAREENNSNGNRPRRRRFRGNRNGQKQAA